MIRTLVLAALVCQTTAINVVRMQQESIDQSHYNERLPQANGAKGKFAFASYYNNHMVLQGAPQRAVIWGTYPDIGERIIVKVADLPTVYSVVVEKGPGGVGVWKVTLVAVPKGGPHTITATGMDGISISLTDVLFGDVWVCSGQSNMQFSADQMYNASKELAEASKYKMIRLFTVALKYSAVPQFDLEAVAEPWSLPNATTVGKSPFSYFSAVCWLFGKELFLTSGYPVGLIDTTWGGTPVEAWSSPDALAKCGLKVEDTENGVIQEELDNLNGPTSNSQLWNAMVYPLLPLTIYGTLWYQGEADSSGQKMNMYNCTFPAMIDDWRLKFSAASDQTKPDFPFGFVQLSGNRPDLSVSVGFPDIRWHQTADYGYVPNPRMKNVFMAVAMDLPDFSSPWGSIHPRDKQDVAQRLFAAGQYVAYGNGSKPLEGPRPVRVDEQYGSVTLTYNQSESLRLAHSLGFEFCCSWDGVDVCDKKSWWLPAPITSFTPTSLNLDGSVCGPNQYITALRYAWRESPCVFKKCAVYSNVNGLPSPPFITVKPPGASSFTYAIDWSQPQHMP